MVLLTMTVAMVHAVEEFLAWKMTDPLSCEYLRHTPDCDEPDLNDPKIGKPISHGQLIDISGALLKHWRPHGDVAGGREPFRLDYLLRGSTIYVPPAKRKPEPVSGSRTISCYPLLNVFA
jgi:hypothetical protein